MTRPALLALLLGGCERVPQTAAERCRLIIGAHNGFISYGDASASPGICRLHRANADCEADLDRLCKGWRR